MLAKDEDLLKKMFVKGFELTDQWMEMQVNHRKDMINQSKSIGLVDDNHGEGIEKLEHSMEKAVDYRASSPTKELKDHNLMQKLIENDGDYKKSSLFASATVHIRNNLYYILSRCIKVTF